MKLKENLKCNKCNNNQFILRYEAKYVYSYIVDLDAPGINNEENFFPFLYDSREQTEANQYIECRKCGEKYPLYSDNIGKGIDSTSLENTITLNKLTTK